MEATMRLGVFALCIAIGLLQLTAFSEGVTLITGWETLSGSELLYSIALVMLYIITMSIPFGAIAIIVLTYHGAHTGFHWTWWQAGLLAFPAIVPLIFGLFGSISFRSRAVR